MRLALLSLIFLIAPGPVPVSREVGLSEASQDFVVSLRAKGKTSGQAVGDLYDTSVRDLAEISALMADLLEYKLEHSRGCRFNDRRPRKHRCSCGLLNKIATLRTALKDWDSQSGHP